MAFLLLIGGLSFRSTKTKTLTQENIFCAGAERVPFYSVTQSLLSNQSRLTFELCLLFQNDMCGKFTRRNPQES